MLTADEIYRKIDNSNLPKNERNKLHDWYGNKHTNITQQTLSRLGEIKKWRESQLEKLQKKVLRRLR